MSSENDYIDVRFHFQAEHDDGYTHYELVSAERVGTDIPDDAMTGIGETLAQSDRWNVGGVGATLDAMTSGGKPKALRNYW
ncbi:hypothetical protein JVX95_31265 [Mycolicibacterium septicum]|nr:hypothetical protein JVX95_31265 [Mycolicibacterium septicum]